MNLSSVGGLYSISYPPTLTQQISDIKSYEISYRELHTKAVINDYSTKNTIGIPFLNIISKYKDNLTDIIIEVELDDIQQRDYLYQPKKLSEFLYGTTELWFELLRLNHFPSISDFKPGNVVKIYDPGNFKEYINEILILEKLV